MAYVSKRAPFATFQTWTFSPGWMSVSSSSAESMAMLPI
jgi:hypothetical protein